MRQVILATLSATILYCCPAIANTNTDSLGVDSLGRRYSVYTYDSIEKTFHAPRIYDFGKNIPRDWGEICRRTASKNGLITVGAVAASTAALIVFDQDITNGVQRFGRWAGIDASRKNFNALSFKAGGTNVDLLDLPRNGNTTLYFIGEGWPSIAFASGLLVNGLIKHDERDVLTASQFAECYIAMGITTQLIKHTTGRESPFVATKSGGKWKFFPNQKKYQKSVPKHDAFPSGHMATAMATVTILATNYPEHTYIRPVGYSVMALVGFAMINNGVHWISDYPLSLAIGYAYGKIATSRGVTIKALKRLGTEKDKGKITFGPSLVDERTFGVGLHVNL